jgi:NAD(P)-dependent dehydrogenase (short-subunit alcohol dehydrogenase family)
MAAGKDFDGAVIIVTGASTGLGRAIAVDTAARGARAVVVNYASSADEAAETARQVEAAGAKAHIVQGDVGKDEDCRRIAAAAQSYGHVDALFNNAGITKFAGNHADLDALSAEDFQRLYAVNVIGAYQMVRAARTLLEAAPSGAGAVVNTASIAGVVGIGSSVAYAASKGAMITMTISLARALAPKIRVNAVCPGFIDTPWFARSVGEAGLQAMRERVAGQTPLKLASTAEDIAGPTVFLGSPASRHITGETLIVDAGTHLGFAAMGMR